MIENWLDPKCLDFQMVLDKMAVILSKTIKELESPKVWIPESQIMDPHCIFLRHHWLKLTYKMEKNQIKRL